MEFHDVQNRFSICSGKITICPKRPKLEFFGNVVGETRRLDVVTPENAGKLNSSSLIHVTIN